MSKIEQLRKDLQSLDREIIVDLRSRVALIKDIVSLISLNQEFADERMFCSILLRGAWESSEAYCRHQKRLSLDDKGT